MHIIYTELIFVVDNDIIIHDCSNNQQDMSTVYTVDEPQTLLDRVSEFFLQKFVVYPGVQIAVHGLIIQLQLRPL